MQHARGAYALEQRAHGGAVRHVQALKRKARVWQQALQARLLQGHVVIGVKVVYTHHALAPRQQGLRAMHADEAGAAGDQGDAHGCLRPVCQVYS
mgnify:CR=1 FL=1